MRKLKLKGKTGFSLKKIAVTATVIYALLTVLRIYQTFFTIDGATGFFNAGDITAIPMYILSIGSVLLVCAFCFVSGDCKRGEINKKGNILYGISAVLLALMMFISGGKGIFDAFGADSVYSFTFIINGGFNAVKEAFGGVIGLLSVVFSFLGGIVVLTDGIFSALGKELPSFMKLPMLLPVAWAFSETLALFSITVNYVRVSQMLLHIFALVFTMVFLFENARLSSDIGKKDSLWFFYASGIVSAGLSFSSCIPYLLASVFAPEKIVSDCPFDLFVIACGIFAVAAMIRRSGAEADEEAAVSVSETL